MDNRITVNTPVMRMANRNKWQDPEREDTQNRITSTQAVGVLTGKTEEWKKVLPKGSLSYRKFTNVNMTLSK